jgi:hypothetical protein
MPVKSSFKYIPQKPHAIPIEVVTWPVQSDTGIGDSHTWVGSVKRVLFSAWKLLSFRFSLHCE